MDALHAALVRGTMFGGGIDAVNTEPAATDTDIDAPPDMPPLVDDIAPTISGLQYLQHVLWYDFMGMYWTPYSYTDLGGYVYNATGAEYETADSLDSTTLNTESGDEGERRTDEFE